MIEWKIYLLQEGASFSVAPSLLLTKATAINPSRRLSLMGTAADTKYTTRKKCRTK